MSIFVMGTYSQTELQYFIEIDLVNHLNGTKGGPQLNEGEEQVSEVKIKGGGL